MLFPNLMNSKGEQKFYVYFVFALV